jgi:hypothetical protein
MSSEKFSDKFRKFNIQETSPSKRYRVDISPVCLSRLITRSYLWLVISGFFDQFPGRYFPLSHWCRGFILGDHITQMHWKASIFSMSQSYRENYIKLSSSLSSVLVWPFLKSWKIIFRLIWPARNCIQWWIVLVVITLKLNYSLRN